MSRISLDSSDEGADQKVMEFEDVVDSLGFGFFQVRLLAMTGLVWCIDAIELMLMSYFPVSVGCAWQLSDSDVALLTIVIFVGAMVGSVLFGSVADRFGRRMTIYISNILLFTFALASSFSVNFPMLLVLRGLVGLMTGGTMTGVVLLMEYIPKHTRGLSVIILLIFWALGVLFESVLAYLILPHLSWRYLFGFSSIPVFLIILILPWIPESARYLLSKNQVEQAHDALMEIARLNKIEYNRNIVIRWRADESHGFLDGFKKLLGREMRRTTVLLWLIWFLGAFCYFGAVILTVELPKFNSQMNRCNSSMANESFGNCTLTSEEFVEVIIASSGELFGTFLVVVCIDSIGRKFTLLGAFAVLAALFPIFYICLPGWLNTALVFLFRALIAGGYQVVWVYTPEIYTTDVRSFGSSLCVFMSRIGAMISPYISLVVIQVPQIGLILCLALYGAAAAIAAICSGLLPKETKGQGMHEGFDSVPEIDETTALEPELWREQELFGRKKS